MRIAFYIVFALVAAPFEAWTLLGIGLGLGDEELLMRPYSNGLLFLAALIFFCESLFRLSLEWADIMGGNRSNWATGFYQAIFVTVILGAIGTGFIYVVGQLKAASGGEIIDPSGAYQRWVFAAAVLTSLLTFVWEGQNGHGRSKRSKIEPLAY